MNDYQRPYAELFALVLAGRWHSRGAELLRARMDAMPPHGRGGDELKTAWGVEIGTRLYEAALAGR